MRQDRLIRLIARLDVKGPNLVKGVQLEGLRVVGDPREHALRYQAAGIDEILYMDIVASLYGRNNLREIVYRTTEEVFVPITVGGGLRSVEDVRDILRAGADKVAINTAAIRRPGLINEVAESFGSQCMVLSVEAKRTAPGRWEALCNNGREPTGVDVLEWVSEAADRGAGEVLLTSVDQEGTCRGFDVELVNAVVERAPVPVIAGGGMGRAEDLGRAVEVGGVDAVAIAHALHYNKVTLDQLRVFSSGRSWRLRPAS